MKTVTITLEAPKCMFNNRKSDVAVENEAGERRRLLIFTIAVSEMFRLQFMSKFSFVPARKTLKLGVP